jgi:hypothetical protein
MVLGLVKIYPITAGWPLKEPPSGSRSEIVIIMLLSVDLRLPDRDNFKKVKVDFEMIAIDFCRR